MFIIEALGFVLLFVIIIALGAFTAASVVLSYIYWIVVAAFSVTAIAALCSRLVRFFKRKARRSSYVIVEIEFSSEPREIFPRLFLCLFPSRRE